ncbi:MAG TPA: hypothetical protein EYQ61_03150 [Dehalococcoidia bacterium]|nr:hypothetical protein [Dehalococcoidia bacterium]HIK90063.1 hypothetical protein [Dehalococcoidia bacterium]
MHESVVWAIDEWHSPMYFFPRECPRLLLWPIEGSTAADIQHWMGESPPRMVAYIESVWVDRFSTCQLYRYELRIIERLQEVAHSLTSSLHFSAIRYRNAIEWDPPI